MSLTVIQWTTGNVGKEAVKGVLSHPDLELVGCYAHSPEKVGADVGVLCGIDSLGVFATDDVDALFDLRPDCVIYTPLFPDVSTMCRILEAGVNIVTSAGFVTGWGLGAEHKERLQAAAMRGGVSLFGSGMTPGFNNLIGIVSAGCSRRIDKITVIESARADVMPSPDTYKSIGMALPPNDSNLPKLAENGTRVFGDGVCLMAEALGKQLDDIICVPSFALATRDVDCSWMQIPKWHVAGIEVAWRGMAGSRCVVELIGRWVMDEPLDPAWEIFHGWRCLVEGYPGIKTSVEVNPSEETAMELASMPGLVALAMSVTAMPVVNAIPAVCAAPAGIRTYLDLPITTGRLQ